MRKILLLTTYFLVSFFGYGQCPNEVIILGSQTDIDNFTATYPGCTELLKGLVIGVGSGSATVINLNGLSQITAVGLNPDNSQGISINFTENLQSLQGLNAVEYVSGLAISGTAITNFNGLENLATIEESFSVQANPNLINFEGLSSVSVIGEFFQIGNNNALVNFEGLGGSITSVNGNPGDLNIGTNLSLENLDGLEGLLEARNVSIFDNLALTSIDGVANLEMINGTVININDNPLLSDCAIKLVCDSFANSNVFRVISNNQTGCNTEQEVAAACLLSISEFDPKIDIVLFPNPVSEKLQIRIAEGIVFEKVVVYSVLGEALFFTSEENVDCSQLVTGIYFVEVTTDHGTIAKKIVKE